MPLKLEHHKDYILNEFDKGTSVADISRQLGEYAQPVSTLIKKYRNLKTLSKNGTFNYNYFSNIDSHEKAYFLGFIAGDGCLIVDKRSNCISLTITIHNKDRIILERMRQAFEMTRPLYEITSKDHVRLLLSHPTFIADIMKYGITPNKSLTMPNIIPNIPEPFRNSFILGLFDADGSVTVRVATYNNNKRGTKVEQLQQSVQFRCTEEIDVGICKELNIASYYINKSAGIPNLAISARSEFIKFYEGIYKDCPIFLNRKHDKFLPIVRQDKTISSSLAIQQFRALGARVEIIA